MAGEKSKTDRDVKKVWSEVLKQIDFDTEALSEADPKEIELLVRQAAMNVLGKTKAPRIEWMRQSPDFYMQGFLDEEGELVLN